MRPHAIPLVALVALAALAAACHDDRRPPPVRAKAVQVAPKQPPVAKSPLVAQAEADYLKARSGDAEALARLNAVLDAGVLVGAGESALIQDLTHDLVNSPLLPVRRAAAGMVLAHFGVREAKGELPPKPAGWLRNSDPNLRYWGIVLAHALWLRGALARETMERILTAELHQSNPRLSTVMHVWGGFGDRDAMEWLWAVFADEAREPAARDNAACSLAETGTFARPLRDEVSCRFYRRLETRTARPDTLDWSAHALRDLTGLPGDAALETWRPRLQEKCAALEAPGTARAEALSAEAKEREAAGDWLAAARALADLLSVQLADANADRWATLMRLAWLEQHFGDHALALGHLNEALALAPQATVRGRRALTLAWLGWTYATMGRSTMALLVLDQAATDPDVDAQPPALPFALAQTGLVHLRLGHLEDAEKFLDRALDLAKARRLPEVEILAEDGRARLATKRGKPADAKALLDGALATVAAEPSLQPHEGGLRVDLARALAALGQEAEAKTALETARKTCEERGQPRCEARALAELAKTAGDAKTAYDLAARATEILTGIHDEDSGVGFTVLATSLVRLDHESLARFYAAQGLAVATESFRPDVEAAADDAKTRIEVAAGNPQAALAAARAAVEAARRAGDRDQLVDLLEKLGDLERVQGARQQAATRWREILVVLAAMPAEPGASERGRKLAEVRARALSSLWSTAGESEEALPAVEVGR